MQSRHVYVDTAVLEKTRGVVIRGVKIIGFSLLLGLSARIRMPLPFTPVPFTLQTFVLFLTMFFLKRDSVYSVLGYLFLGGLGFPFFAFGSGFAYLLSPTGGYLAGFMLSALIVGPVFEKTGKSITAVFLLCTGASIIFYTCGVWWLMFLYSNSLHNALIAGFLPFLIPEVIKISAALAIFKIIRR